MARTDDSRRLQVPALLAAATLALGSANAQVTADLRTATDYGTFAGPVRQFLPAGTQIATPRTVTASEPGGSASAVLTPGVLGFTLRDSASTLRSPGSGGSAGTASQAPGPHDLMWTVSGRGGGTLDVDISMWGGLADYSRCRLWIDVGDDGTFEVARSGIAFDSLSIPIVVDGSVPIRVRTDAVAAALALWRSDSYFIDLTLGFTPAVVPVAATAYGPSCGATLAASEVLGPAHHDLRFDVAGGYAGGAALLVFGARRASIPIGNSGCLVLTDPLNGVILPSDGNGDSSLRLVIGALRATVRIQAFPFDPTSTSAFTASRGLELVFAD